MRCAAASGPPSATPKLADRPPRRPPRRPPLNPWPGCTGKRDRTAFRSLAEFDDSLLASDLGLLQEAVVAADAARRAGGAGWVGGRGPARAPYLPPHLRQLQAEAQRRGVSLRLQPQGMAKRNANTSRYDSHARRLLWRIEWRFAGAGVGAVDRRAVEGEAVGALLARHLGLGSGGRVDCVLQGPVNVSSPDPEPVVSDDCGPPGDEDAGHDAPGGGGGVERAGRAVNIGAPPSDAASQAAGVAGDQATCPDATPNPLPATAVAAAPPGSSLLPPPPPPHPPSKLAPFRAAGLEGLAILLPLEPRPANAPAWARLDPGATLGDALRGRTVTEFPTLTVVLPDELGGYVLA